MVDKSGSFMVKKHQTKKNPLITERVFLYCE